MSLAERLRDEHASILAEARKITNLLDADALSRDAGPVRDMLEALKGEIEQHLYREDEALYPALMRHPEKSIKSMAKKFSKEMGEIREAFGGYAERWSDPKVIQDKSEEFVKETQHIFDALSQRIDKEDNELYPLLRISA